MEKYFGQTVQRVSRQSRLRRRPEALGFRLVLRPRDRLVFRRDLPARGPRHGERRNKVTNVTKSNTLIHSLAYWDKVIAEVAAQYPDVEYNKMYVDNAAASFVLRPEVFDVIVTTNMIGDILSDLGGAIMGSLGLGPSGNINPEGDFPSMFEPIHGSYPQAY